MWVAFVIFLIMITIWSWNAQQHNELRGFIVFGFGKKKKLEEFAKLLSELGDITQKAADKYVADNEIEIQAAFKRGLNPFASVAYISDNQMERISNAHHLGELHLAKNIDDFWLLVALNCVVAMESAGVPSEQLNFNFKYWNKVIEMPIDPVGDDFTYGDRLQQLVDAMKAKTTQGSEIQIGLRFSEDSCRSK